MTSDIAYRRIGELESEVDALRRSVGQLNLAVSDLLALWSLVLDGREIPADFGVQKFENLRYGRVFAQFRDKGRSDRLQAAISPEHALDTLENQP